MRRNLLMASALLLLVCPALPRAFAQEPAEVPTVTRTRVVFKAVTINSYRGDPTVWGWLPEVSFITEGGEPYNGDYYVEVSQPGGAPWLKGGCETFTNMFIYTCDVPDGQKENAITATGVFSFSVKMGNPLEGTDKTLFTGRAKVEKVLSSEVGPTSARKFVYYTNQDWNLPIGYVFIGNNDNLYVRFWVRGEDTASIEAHLFYRGQEVGRFEKYGYQYGASRCSPDIEYRPTRDAGAGAPQGAKWARMNCPFETVRTEPNPNSPEWHIISANPWEYEVKVLRNKRLARVLKFSIGPDGNIVDNGIASGNGMAWSNLIFVPVQVVGDLDGVWDRNAWKTDAFYGHPLNGFNWPPQ